MKNLILLSAATIFLTLTSNAQKIKVTEGDSKLSFLSGVKEIHLEYDYSDMSVGKYDKEEDYVNDRTKDRNEKEAGTGDKWKDSWFGSRERVYQPKFETLFNKGLEKKGISAGEASSSTITLVVHTIFTEPGFNVGVTSRPAAVSFNYIFKDESGKVLAKFTQLNVPGAQAMGMDFDTSTRISESYAKAGKMLAAYIAKQLK